MNSDWQSSSEYLVHLGPGVTIKRSDLGFSFSRASGPGGQAVNKLSTRAELRVAITALIGLPADATDRLRRLAGRRLTQSDEIVIHAETFRSQLDNKQACIERLGAMVAQALIRPKIRRKTKPSRAMKRKRLDQKRKHSQKKGARRRLRDDDA